MGGNPGLDNGEYFMRRIAQAQQQALNQYNPYQSPQQALNQYKPYQSPLITRYNPYSSSAGPPTPGERPEPEDTTGLKMLEELLTKRKSERGG